MQCDLLADLVGDTFLVLINAGNPVSVANPEDGLPLVSARMDKSSDVWMTNDAGSTHVSVGSDPLPAHKPSSSSGMESPARFTSLLASGGAHPTFSPSARQCRGTTVGVDSIQNGCSEVSDGALLDVLMSNDAGDH
eukprot:8903923-Karenia_brevis.AAC.1